MPYRPGPRPAWYGDVLAAVARGGGPCERRRYADVYASPGNQANLARFNFLDPASRRFHLDWDQAADIAVAILRTEAGRNPHDNA